MTFAVKARVLLELGGELISSDAIALYELIKNAVDAGSEKIEVRFSVALTGSGYTSVLHEIQALRAERVPSSLIDDAIATAFDPGTPQAVKDEFKRLLANAAVSAARKRLREFFVQHSYIEIEDWGHGMSLREVRSYYLTIGTPHRAMQRRREGDEGKNTVLGEKGIGRLSVMRLGRKLEMRTTQAHARRWVELTVDWASIGENLDMDLADFAVQANEGERKSDPKIHGTLLRISDLQGDWSSRLVKDVAGTQLSKIQDPFDRKASRLDLRLFFNGESLKEIPELDQSWLKHWHGYFNVKFRYMERGGLKEPTLTGTVKYKVPAKDIRADEDRIDVKDISAVGSSLYSVLAAAVQPQLKGGAQGVAARFAGIDTLGAFNAEGYWFNRQRSRNEMGKENYPAFSAWLGQWGGGLLMYRDGFRVNPYADRDDDWLELDQKALRQRSFKLNRGQFAGTVRISARDNKFLLDQTNRQGLVDSPEKRALVAALQYVIWSELGSLVKKYEVRRVRRALGSVEQLDKQVKERAKDARGKLRELGSKVPEEAQSIQLLRNYIDDLELAWAKAKGTIKQQQLQADVYLHLAGVGMLVEFVMHELTRATHATLADLSKLRDAQLSPGLRSLGQQLRTLEKRLRVLDPVSTPGRQRKDVVDVCAVLRTLLEAHEEQFERHEIQVVWQGTKTSASLKAKVVEGQMYQIFENLIANSVYWLGHQKAVLAQSRQTANRFKPTITIDVDRDSRTISFSDNGPGIDPADSKKVFEPFFSKKPGGRGVGLYIVRSLCGDNHIELSLLKQDQREVHPGFSFMFPST